MTLTSEQRRRTGGAFAAVAYGQYGTFTRGTSEAEVSGIRTPKPTAARLSANPKSGASPQPQGDALEFAAAELDLIKLRKDTASDRAVINREMHAVKRQVKACAKAEDWAGYDRAKAQSDNLRAEAARLLERLCRAEDKYADWAFYRANKGYSPKKGFITGGDFVAGEKGGTRSSKGQAEAAKVAQEKGYK